MRPVIVLVFHPPVAPDAGPLTRALGAARAALAEAHRIGFLAAGATDVRIIADADDRTFGERLRAATAGLPTGVGAVVLGSGSIPLATAGDRRRLVEAAGADQPGVALANNRYSGDVVALPDARAALVALPDLPGDNALPRWLEERGGLRVIDLRGHWTLQADLDGVADLVLLARSHRCPPGIRALARADDARLDPVRARVAAVTAVGADRRAEIVVSGRASAAGLAHLETATACRVRALIEERGLRAASPLAQDAAGGAGAAPGPAGERQARPATRPPTSILGIGLDTAGPGALGPTLARLGDAAIVDTRVLLVHARGADEHAWPPLEDRLASDLLLADRVADPWLRSLTESAAAAPIPVLLGGHSLVGPGLRLLFPAPGRARSSPRGPRP